jgi:hypothetical protein
MSLYLFNLRCAELLGGSHGSLLEECWHYVILDSLSAFKVVLDELIIDPIILVDKVHDRFTLSEEKDFAARLWVIKIPRRFLQLSPED